MKRPERKYSIPSPFYYKKRAGDPRKIPFFEEALSKRGKIPEIAKEATVCSFPVKSRLEEHRVEGKRLLPYARADRKMKSPALFRSINFTPGRTKQPAVSDFSEST